MTRRTPLVMAAAVLLVGAAACAGSGSGAAPEPTRSPAVTSATASPGFDPDDPVGVVLAMLDQIRRAGSGHAVETRTATSADVTLQMKVETTFDAQAGRSLSVITGAPGDGTTTELRFGFVGEAPVMQAPAAWGQPPGTWYRLDDVAGRDADGSWLQGRAPHLDLPSRALEVLAGVHGPAWVAEGDATSSTVRYELVAPGRTGLPLLPGAPAEEELQPPWDAALDNRVLPVSVEVHRDGSLSWASIDLTPLVGFLAAVEGEEAVPDLTVAVTVEVSGLGEAVRMDLPDLATVLPGAAMPQELPDVARL